MALCVDGYLATFPNAPKKMNAQITILVAGGSGDLGSRIVEALIARDAAVRVLIRPGKSSDVIKRLRTLGATIVEADYDDAAALQRACTGVACVISTISGLREAIVDAQAKLLAAAVAAGVPRFIPSDFSCDFTKLDPGSNRNLDLRREFKALLDAAPIAATSVLNGMFADLLKGDAPVILFKQKLVFFWGNADQKMDFTTIADTALYVAMVALDPTTPRILRIAGMQMSMRDIADTTSALQGTKFRLFRPGNLSAFRLLIRIVRKLMPDKGEIYPPWQGMQYMENMLGGKAKLEPLDNDRYPGMHWTSLRTVLNSR